MRKTITGVLVLACTCLLNGCAMYKTPVRPPQAVLFTHIRAPLSTELSGDGSWERKGDAKTFYVGWSVFSFGWGDCSIEAAAKDGRVRRISYADYEFTSVFWVFRQLTVHVYGHGAAGVPAGAS